MKKLYFILTILAGTCLFVQGKNIPEGPATASNPIIINLGSGTVKAGLASQAAPITFPAVVAKSGATYYVGEEAIAKSKSMGLTLRYPVEHGIVTNWTEVKELLRHAFSRLNADPANHEVLIAEAPLNPKTNREKITSMLFNDFNVKGMYVAVNGLLAMYATNRNTAIILHSGENVSHMIPVYEGSVMKNAIFRLDLANRDLADYMVQKLKNKGHNINREIAYDIMKKTGYAAYNPATSSISNHFKKEMEKPENQIMKSYQLPNGQTINIGRERFNVIETLFQPAFIGMGSAGIHETAYNAIRKCDVGIRNALYGNIILSGINTIYPGTAERIKKEISALAPPAMKINVIAPENREYLVWTGGKKLVPLLSPNKMWITRAEFNAEGPGVVHRKCF